MAPSVSTPDAQLRSSIFSERRARRAELLARRMALPEDEHRSGSKAVLERLLSGFSELRSERIGMYWPYRREISLFPFAKSILAEGGEVAFPVAVERQQPLQFRAWKPGDPLSRGVYDIPFPRDGATVQPQVLIVPLLGFDEEGHRLGYGGGYYDRTLAVADPKPLTIGVGFEFARLKTIQPLPHDVPMDVIVTEAGVSWRRSTGG